MEIEFFGVRGSIATAGHDRLRYGGNTSCVSVRAGGRELVFDAGTGLVPAGQRIQSGQRVDLFLSHLHWDHIQGFPFFQPGYTPGTDVVVHAISHGGEHFAPVEQVLSAQMSPPCFPVGLEVMGGNLHFVDVSPGAKLQLDRVEVRHTAVDHPNGCHSYRVDCDGKSVVYATDLEHGDDVDPALCELARGADILIYDSMYTPEEYSGEVGPPKKGWGHSTFMAGAALADKAGVKQLMLFHHDPSHDDIFMDGLRDRAAKRRPGTDVAREGLVIKL